ncbi:hypothetical protein ASE88_05985 [Sphingomonas sp. Leaf38]|nr:hypothetical protein ASE88_05985 [Sphingomonas sp. Leaf38]
MTVLRYIFSHEIRYILDFSWFKGRVEKALRFSSVTPGRQDPSPLDSATTQGHQPVSIPTSARTACV